MGQIKIITGKSIRNISQIEVFVNVKFSDIKPDTEAKRKAVLNNLEEKLRSLIFDLDLAISYTNNNLHNNEFVIKTTL